VTRRPELVSEREARARRRRVRELREAERVLNDRLEQLITTPRWLLRLMGPSEVIIIDVPPPAHRPRRRRRRRT
jgi:hypothetical protein